MATENRANLTLMREQHRHHARQLRPAHASAERQIVELVLVLPTRADDE
jgi:hypothetical protein